MVEDNTAVDALGILPGALEFVITQREQRERARGFFNDPAGWVEYMTGTHLWSKQAEIAEDLITHRNVAVKACHGSGKSYMAALLICWWIDTRYPNVFVASTAPSTAQISAIVWRYVKQIKSLIASRYAEGLIDHQLIGYITADNQWKDSDEGVLIGFGRKPPDNKEDSAFQGIHDGYVLFIADEAVGLSEDMIRAGGAITSNPGSCRLLLCNPTNPASYIGKLFKDQTKGWAFHTISVFDSPAFTDEGNKFPKDVLNRFVGQGYVDDMAAEFGEESAPYISRVLGEFAFDMGETFITPADISPCHDVDIMPSYEARPILGVDVSGTGDDQSVVYINHDSKVRFLARIEGASYTTETAAAIHELALKHYASEVRVDAVGIGQGVVGELVRLAEGRYLVISMVGNAASPDKYQWRNARAYWWHNVRKELRAGNFDIDPSDQMLEDQLCSVKYAYDDGSTGAGGTGGLLIEAKTAMKKRGLKSPDYADAFIYSTADLSHLYDNPLASLKSGDTIMEEPEKPAWAVFSW